MLRNILMFELRNEEGLFPNLIANHLCQGHNNSAEFFRLCVNKQFELVVELIKDGSHLSVRQPGSRGDADASLQ